MAEEDQDKTEQATPFKLREAKRRGQVAKSLEFNSMMVIFFLLAISAIWAKTMIGDLFDVNRDLLANAHSQEFSIAAIIELFKEIMFGLLVVLLPVFLGMIVISVLMNFFQTGPVFSFFSIKPDFKKLNPVTGFKRVFSKKMLFEAFKSLIKLAFFASILFMVIRSLIPDISRLMDTDPNSYVLMLLNLAVRLILALAIAVMLVAILDMLYTRWDFAKKMMMSRRELKDEIKRREGDPHVKQKMKEVQREAAKRTQSLQRVPEADVLITNPTHYAVAIKYDKSKMNAPFVIAKGAGSLAQKIKFQARKHSVPVIERKQLARELFRETDINEPVSEKVYAELAKILIWAYRQRNRVVLGSDA